MIRFSLTPAVWCTSVTTAILLAGCSSSSQPDAASIPGVPTDQPTTAPAPTEAPKRSTTGPAVKPPAGLGNAQGRVLYDGKPAAGIDVSLCEEIGFISGCGGKTFKAKTDKDGNYTVDKVKPGEYSLAVRVFDTNYFIYPTTGILSASKFKVEADQTLDIRVVNLWKTDLKTLSPQVGASVKSSKPELKWQAYPGATQYKVSITGSGSSFGDMETASTSITPEKALLDGEYKWKVEALNGEGTKIAENARESIFKVVGTGASSKVELVQPKRDALVDGKVKFVWKSNPQATVHQIYLSQVGNNTPILSFVPTEGSEYTPATPLAKGQYFWSISAKRDGDQIAASELIPFTVK